MLNTHRMVVLYKYCWWTSEILGSVAKLIVTFCYLPAVTFFTFERFKRHLAPLHKS